MLLERHRSARNSKPTYALNADHGMSDAALKEATRTGTSAKCSCSGDVSLAPQPCHHINAVAVLTVSLPPCSPMSEFSGPARCP